MLKSIYYEKIDRKIKLSIFFKKEFTIFQIKK